MASGEIGIAELAISFKFVAGLADGNGRIAGELSRIGQPDQASPDSAAPD
jgi:hypothetical protein